MTITDAVKWALCSFEEEIQTQDFKIYKINDVPIH